LFALPPFAEPKEHSLDEVTTAVEIPADRRASLFVFPSTSESVLATPPRRQIDRMDETTTELPETSELRATVMLFALVLMLPTLLGCALLFGR
jgi:hypothetical protein